MNYMACRRSGVRRGRGGARFRGNSASNTMRNFHDHEFRVLRDRGFGARAPVMWGLSEIPKTSAIMHGRFSHVSGAGIAGAGRTAALWHCLDSTEPPAAEWRVLIPVVTGGSAIGWVTEPDS
jgi:hypothetical protein